MVVNTTMIYWSIVFPEKYREISSIKIEGHVEKGFWRGKKQSQRSRSKFPQQIKMKFL